MNRVSRCFVAACIATLLCVAPSLGSAQGVQLIQNGNLDSWTGGAPVSWDVVQTSDAGVVGGTAGISEETTIVKSGSSMNINPGGGFTYRYVAHTNDWGALDYTADWAVSIYGNDVARTRVMVFVQTDGTGPFAVNWGMSGTNGITNVATPPAGWNDYSGTFAAGTFTGGINGTDRYRLSIHAIDAGSYVDDFSLIHNEPTYTLTYTAGAGGSIVGTSPQYVPQGGSGSGTLVTAQPNTGYDFVKWSDDVMTASRTDINVTADITVEAQFALNQYTLTYTAGANGSISGDLLQTVNHGADGTEVVAVADPGYKFDQWSDTSTVNPRTDTSVTGDITVTASFIMDSEYTVTYTAGTNGLVNGMAQVQATVAEGNSGPEVTAQPNTGYHFVNWTPGDSTVNPRQDTNVTDDITVTANFAANTWTVTFDYQSATTQGIVSKPVTFDTAYGELPAPERAFHNFLGWFTAASGGDLVTDATIVATDADHTLFAQWALVQYTLTYTAGAGGTVQGPSPQTVEHGSDGAEVTAVPFFLTHAFVEWSDGVATAARTDLAVTGDMTVSAVFAPLAEVPYTVLWEDDFEDYLDTAALTADYDENTLVTGGLHIGPDVNTRDNQSLFVHTDDVGRVSCSWAPVSSASAPVTLSFWFYDVNPGGTVAGRNAPSLGAWGGGAWAAGALDNFISFGPNHGAGTEGYYSARVVNGGSGWVVTTGARAEGWQKLEVVLEAGTATFYLNDVQVHSDTYAEPASGWNSLRIGSTAGAAYRHSWIDDVKVTVGEEEPPASVEDWRLF